MDWRSDLRLEAMETNDGGGYYRRNQDSPRVYRAQELKGLGQAPGKMDWPHDAGLFLCFLKIY